MDALSNTENFGAAKLQVELHPSTGNTHPAEPRSFKLHRGDASNFWKVGLAVF